MKRWLSREHGRRALGFALIVVGVLASAGAAMSGHSASAAVVDLKVEPAAQTVAVGATFTVEVRSTSAVALTGLQADLQFDHTVLEIVAVNRGAPWSTASFLLGRYIEGSGVQTKAEAIAEANTTGVLENAALFLLPPNKVDAGERVALVIDFKARDGVNNFSPLVLTEVSALDAANQPIGDMSATGGIVQAGDPNLNPPTKTPTPSATATVTETPTATPTVTPTVDPAASATPTSPATSTATVTATATMTNTATATATSQASSTPTTQPTSTPVGATATPAAQSATMQLVPNSQTVPPGADVTIHISHTASFPALGAEADFVFDANLLSIASVSKSPGYAAASMLAGTTDPNVPGSRQTLDQAIAEANSTGRLKNLAVFYQPNQGQAAPGENAFVTVKLKAKSADGTSQIKLEGVEMIGLDGEPFAVNPSSGEVVVQTGAVAPTPVPPPVAEGSGATAGGGAGTPGSTTNRVAGVAAGGSTGVRGLPSAGAEDAGSAGATLVFVLGLALTAAGLAVLSSNMWLHREREV